MKLISSGTNRIGYWHVGIANKPAVAGERKRE
jgi:hypothetical protein